MANLDMALIQHNETVHKINKEVIEFSPTCTYVNYNLEATNMDRCFGTRLYVVTSDPRFG